MARVVHCKKAKHDVYIGRGSIWGNPFVIGPDGDRQEVIDKFRKWLLTQPRLIARARLELRDSVLGCWCAPLACHGDVLRAVAEADDDCEWCGGTGILFHAQNSSSARNVECACRGES